MTNIYLSAWLPFFFTMITGVVWINARKRKVNKSNILGIEPN